MSNSVMRQSTTTTVNTRSGTHNDTDFDALLEDLQATVSRSNSVRGGAVNGGSNMSGYREVRRTVKDDATGESTTEYHIEYLNPANSTTHVTEYSTSPYYSHTGYGVAGQHNKEITYKYNTSNQTKGDQVGVINNSTSGFDNVPGSGRTYDERRFREEKRETRSSSAGSTGGARRELVFTGPRSRDPSPSAFRGTGPVTQQVYRYEKTTSTKTIGPDGTVLYDSGGDGGKRGYSEDVRTIRSPSPQYLQYREPSPGKHIETVKYTTASPNQPPGGYSMKQSSYSFNSSHQDQHTSPHRSPSPVAFTQPPPPVRSSVSRTTAASYSYDVPSSPTLAQKFSPSDPTRTTLTYNVSPPQVSTYKYTTTTTSSNKYSDEDTLGKPRPFPTSPSPTPDQQPPKKLDELMASLGDIDAGRQDTTDRHRVHTVRTETTTTSSNQRKEGGPPGGPGGPGWKGPETHAVEQTKEETRNISGPPVYYPKGELFANKEESVIHKESAGGGGKYKAKAKYQYESGSKYKESSDTKVVPVCIPCPCCCAAPCTIM